MSGADTPSLGSTLATGTTKWRADYQGAMGRIISLPLPADRAIQNPGFDT